MSDRQGRVLGSHAVLVSYSLTTIVKTLGKAGIAVRFIGANSGQHGESDAAKDIDLDADGNFESDAIPVADISSICIDSRSARPGALFVALKGEKLDGHSFLGAAASLGARAFLVAEDFAANHEDELLSLARDSGALSVCVADPLTALQALAAAHLADIPGLVRVGITGSNGKTSTKDLVESILSLGHHVFASPGNLNSVIGLPIAALGVDAGHEIAVFEMAMSEKGEMERLARIVFPDFALITNIGLAHIGNIGTQLGIAQEKKKIFSQFDGTQCAVIPADDPWADELARGLHGRISYYGERSSPHYKSWQPWEHGQEIAWKDLSIKVRLHGAHMRHDILGAIRLAEELGASDSEIKEGLESFRPRFGRGEILEGEITIVQDCYNANPDSMKASIRAFMEMPSNGHRHVLVLGDMKELGSASQNHHEEIGALAAGIGADAVVFFGTEMEHAFHAASERRETGRREAGRGEMDSCLDDDDPCGRPDLEYFESFTGLASGIAAHVRKGDLVLLKASRSMELERLSPVLQALVFDAEGRIARV